MTERLNKIVISAQPQPTLRGGLSTGLLAGRFPVDASTDQIAARSCSQPLSAPEPPHSRQSDTKLPSLSTHNTPPDSSPDTAGDNYPTRKCYRNRAVISLDALTVESARGNSVGAYQPIESTPNYLIFFNYLEIALPARPPL